MAINIISKGEADHTHTEQAENDMRTEVLFENRFGRQVYVRLYDAKKMIRRMEGSIIPGTERPIRNKRSTRTAQAPTEAPSETQAPTEAQEEPKKRGRKPKTV